MQYLLKAAQVADEELGDGVFVEVGCYRGVTTRCVAESVAPTQFIAVDPFIGWGGAADDYEKFCHRIATTDNVVHERRTSGEAARNWNHGRVKWIFIDAVHDYWNTNHDLRVWSRKLKPGAFLIAHDTDSRNFAGARRAVYEVAVEPSFEIYAHTDDLVILRKQAPDLV
jgi:hypothetical protein